MRPSFVLLVLLVLAPLAATAQQPALGDSTSALVFNVNGLALNTYDGGLGYLRRLSPRAALLVGVGGRFRRTADAFASGGDESESTATDVDLQLQTGLRVYARPDARTSLYVQGGPSVGWRGNRAENVRTSEEGGRSEQTRETAFLTLGGTVQVGVAYRLTGMFELSGAYALSASYATDLNRAEEVDGRALDRDQSAFALDLATTRVTLAVYF